MRKTIELAKPGLWGNTENATPLTEEDLKELVETFNDIKKAPIALGHTLADTMPALGWVVGVSYDPDKKVLLGDIELSDLLQEAYEKGLYKTWSIGIKRRASDGKRYLHHLAFLGEVPPKIKGLKDLSRVNMADTDETWEIFADKAKLISRAKTDWPIAPKGTSWDADAAKKRLFERGVLDQCCAVIELLPGEDKPEALSRYHFPYCDFIDGRVRIVPKAVSSGLAYLNGARGVKVDPELAKKARPVLERLQEKINKYFEEVKMAEMEQLKKELEAKQQLLADYEAKLKQAKKQELVELAKGKIPKEKLGLIETFADLLPLQEEKEFADENGNKVKKTLLDLLADILKAIPQPVEPGKREEYSDESRVGFGSTNEILDRI